MSKHCDDYGTKLTVEPAVTYKCDSLVHVCQEDLASEWHWIDSCVLSPPITNMIHT